MVRDVAQLTSRTFDVLVVGGGVYGLTIAYDAAQRGLSTALIERDDFGSGNSFNHLRTIHGGLRYLQGLDLVRARQSIRERRTLARIAPHAVRPLVFALPLYRSLMRGKTAMRTGFLLDRLIGADRNQGVPASHRLPPGRVVSRGEAIDRFPGLRQQGLTGAAVWSDYTTPESDRLTFAWAWAAAEHSATLANHVDAVSPLVEGRRVTGVRAIDRATGRAIDIRAGVTVNAAGAAVDRLLAPLGTSTRTALLKAMNLVTRREAGKDAFGARTASGRHLFHVPWRNRALFGTWESSQPCPAEDSGVRADEIASFIAELNAAFPLLELTAGDVTLVHRGLVPATIGPDGRAALEWHEQIRDHAAEGIEGLMSVAGTKYTTARGVAERVTDRLLRKLGRPPVPCRTAIVPLPGGDGTGVVPRDADGRESWISADTRAHLLAAYGSRYQQVLELATDRAEWREQIVDESPVIGAELIWAARHEMAITLGDAVIRRTPLGALGYPGDAAARRAADIVGNELGWTEERRRSEIATLRAFYE